MAKENKKMIYDEEDDILFLSEGKKIKSSIDIGDFIIDIDTKGFVSGIEILNASGNLKLTEEQLKNLQKASMSVAYKPDRIYIYLFMQFNEMEKDITIPLRVDLGHGSLETQRTDFAVA